MDTPTLTIRELVEKNIERAKRWHRDGIEDWSALEWAAAMCGEAGEAANAAKKLKRLEGKIASINEGERNLVDERCAKVAVAKECADTIMYAVLTLVRVGCSAEDVESVLCHVFNRKSEEYGFPERLGAHCVHGKHVSDYCSPCGRVNSAS